MKKIIIVIISLILLFSFRTVGAEEYPLEVPQLNGQAAITIDAQSGEIIFSLNEHQKMYPASTTKIMTAIIVLENCQLDEIVEVDFNSANTEGSSIYLQPGEKFTVEQLLYALLVASANDAAEALACHVAGSIKEFANMMNKRARELGALQTHFQNPHGLPDSQHITTAYDLAQIGLHAIKMPKLIEITSTARYQIPPTTKYPEIRYLKNSNRFLWGTGSGNRFEYLGEQVDIYYPVVNGIKTGYTRAAGNCLVSLAEKDNRKVLAVVLGSNGNNLYRDSRFLIDYALYNYQTKEIVSAGEVIKSAGLSGGIKGKVNLVAQDNVYVTTRLGDVSEIVTTYVMVENLAAPLKEGQVVGRVVYTIKGRVVGQTKLLVSETVKKISWIWVVFFLLIIITGITTLKKWSLHKYNNIYNL